MEHNFGAVLCMIFNGFLVGSFAQFPIENSVIGEPEIECLSHTMSMRFNTRNPFQGHVFVRQHFHEEDCHKDYAMNRENGGFMHLDFDKCGMRRQRTANPRGMSMSTTVIVSFHRSFITLVDKAFKISCFYLEEEKVVTQNLEVSMLPTTDLDMNPPMPSCNYQVLSDGPDGELVTFARIGDKIYHKWTCEYPMPDMYCMIIHSCTVDDGEADESVFEVIDEEGCAKDPIILGDLSYITDLMAGTEAQVFKYADKANVFFTCQVRLSLKNEHPSGVCPKPQCGAAALRRFRFKREDAYHKKEKLSVRKQKLNNDYDLIAPPITVLDIDENVSEPQRLKTPPQMPPVRHIPFVPAVFAAESQTTGVCLSEKPQCGAAALRRFRFKREDAYHKKEKLSVRKQKLNNDYDLIAPPITVLDIDENVSEPQRLKTPPQMPPVRHIPFVPAVFAAESQTTGVCLSEVSFGILMAAALLSCLSTVLFAGVYFVRSRFFK